MVQRAEGSKQRLLWASFDLRLDRLALIFAVRAVGIF